MPIDPRVFATARNQSVVLHAQQHAMQRGGAKIQNTLYNMRSAKANSAQHAYQLRGKKKRRIYAACHDGRSSCYVKSLSTKIEEVTLCFPSIWTMASVLVCYPIDVAMCVVLLSARHQQSVALNCFDVQKADSLVIPRHCAHKPTIMC